MASSVPDVPYWSHTVRQGDTLINLAAQWMKPGADWRAVAALNQIRNPRSLQPGSTLRIPLAMLREEPLVLEVLHAHGEVQLERAGETASGLKGGMSVRTGDLVRTGRQSSVSLRAPDGSHVLLRADSTLVVLRHAKLGAGALQDTELRLDRGAADTQVAPPQAGRPAPRLHIRTPVVNLGVRGTQFRARSAGADASFVEVLSGRVGAAGTTSREVAVPAGYGLRATEAGPGTPGSLPAAPQVQGLPPTVERVPLALQWQAAPAAAWRAQVHAAGRPDQVLLEGLFDKPAAQWAEDLPDGRYGLRLRTVNEQGLEGRDSQYEFVLKARPEPPILVAPPARSRNADETQTLSWTGQPAAARYRLQAAGSPDFALPRIDRSDITGTQLTLELPVGTHHWRIASVRANGDTGPWSNAQTFTRLARPAAPGAEPPETVADGQLLRWRAEPGVRHLLQVARDPAFSTLVVNSEVAQAQWLMAQPEPGTYHLRVRSISAEGVEGPFSSPQTLEVPAPPRPVWPWLLPLLFLLL